MALDNIYWNPSEYEYEEPVTTSLFSKNYIDPWDLENYAYIKQQLGSLDLSSEESSFEESTVDRKPLPLPVPVRKRLRKTMSQPEYSSSSDFPKYASANHFGSRYSDRIRSSMSRETEDIYGVVDFDHESDVEDTSFDETVVSTKDNSFMFFPNKNNSSGKDLHTFPSRERSLSYSFGDYEYEQYSPVNEVYSRLSDTASDLERTVPIYDDIRQTKPHFKLSKCGHLQIDYSWSWNNLDKYIYN